VSLQPPKGLDPVARAAWRDAVAVLIELGEAPQLSRASLARYAHACARAAMLERRWRALGAPVLTSGSAGQDAPHPLLAAIEKAERWAHELGSALGLDPQARRKLSQRVTGGRPAGAASAADRAQPPLRRTLRSVG
jgi:P27 family predicted phage terminase small subunit